MFISYDLTKANVEGLKRVEAFSKEAATKGYKVIGMTASNDETIQKAKADNKLTFDYYFCDGTALKTIERANPSIVVLEKGTIVQKLHWNDIADVVLK